MKVSFKLFAFAISVLISFVLIVSCKSSFPLDGRMVECNGQLLKPILNPTKRAEFPGGEQALYSFLQSNMAIPKEARTGKHKGKIRVAFIVTKEGYICDLRITSKPNKYLDRAVIQAFKIMPKWTPGMNKGEIVDSYWLLDVRFS